MAQMIKGGLPKISIIIPSFNAADYIERSIRSIVEQSYPNLEIFIKDGTSKDGTVSIIKHYASKYPKIIKWQSSKDRGQADAINTGIKQSTGEILAYLNADDVFKPKTLQIVGSYFLKHPEVTWIYGKGDIIDADDKPIRGWITAYKNFWLKNYSLNTLLIINYISQMTVFFRKKAFNDAGPFDIKQHYCLDYDYWLRLGKKFKPGIIDEYLGSFRIVPFAKSSTGFTKQFKDEYNVAEKHTKNPLILLFHKVHYQLIIFIYRLLKIFAPVKKSGRLS